MNPRVSLHRLELSLYDQFLFLQTLLQIYSFVRVKIMHITRKKNTQTPEYRLGNTKITSVPTFQYLGIFISSDLSWKCHINSIVSRANRLLGFIRVVARGASTNAIFFSVQSPDLAHSRIRYPGLASNYFIPDSTNWTDTTYSNSHGLEAEAWWDAVWWTTSGPSLVFIVLS